jgi:hypothetical protein
LNINKTKAMVVRTPQRKVETLNIKMDGHQIDNVEKFNFLGIMLDQHLNWNNHIQNISQKISKTVGILNKLKNFLPTYILSTLYNSLILPRLNYGILAWGSKISKVTKLQKKAIRVISKAKYNAHTEPLFKNLNLLKCTDLCLQHELKFCYNLEKNILPVCFYSFFTRISDVHNIETRQSQNNFYQLPRISHEFAKADISYRIPIIFNNMIPSFRDKIRTHSRSGFVRYVKNHFLNSYSYICNVSNCYVCQT